MSACHLSEKNIKNTSLHSLISFLRIVVKDIQLIVCITLRGSQLKLWFVFIGLRLYVYTMLNHYFSFWQTICLITCRNDSTGDKA